MKIKSRDRRKFKIVAVLLISLYFGLKSTIQTNSTYSLLAILMAAVALFEIVLHTQTYLELTSNSLKVRRQGILNVINEYYEIELEQIQSAYYDKKIYDGWALYRRLLWELFFPSGQRFLIIHLLDDKTFKIPFEGNEQALHNLIVKLPERLPS